MSTPKNREKFIELEYCLDKYFDKCFTPIIKSEYERFRRNAVAETKNRDDGGWSGLMDSASPFSTTHIQQTSGEWNKKTSDDLLEACNKKFLSDPKVQSDISKMTRVCRAVLVGELGVDRYKALSKECPLGDLAAFYVCNRCKTVFVEKLGQMKVPRSSFQYIIEKGLGDTLPGMMIEGMKRSTDLDAEIKSVSEKFYSPNAAEKASSYVLSFIVDSALTGNLSSVKQAASWLVFDGTVHGVKSLFPDGQTFDQYLSNEMWGDKKALDDIRRESKSIDPSSSEDIKSLSVLLNKPVVKARYDDKEALALCSELKGLYGVQAGAALVAGIESVYKDIGLSVNKKTAVPSWMNEKSDKDLHRYACYWSAMAMEMKSKGIQKIVVAKKTYTLEQIAQKGYDYARALNDSQSRSRSARAVPVKNEERSQERPQIGRSENMTVNVRSATASPQSQQAVSQSNVAQSHNDVCGWESLLDQFGLSGFGELGRDFGYVLSMLPDMLINMFTGKSRNLKFGDNLLPIASIIMGMFIKNPFLKMLFIGLGGANLLNKAGHEILENRDGVKSSPARQYREYGDEVLDSRIKEPAMKGNTLIASIDGVPSVITINSADAVDAYYKGVLPLNTLANAVLRKYDEQQRAVQENYDRQVVDETVERSRGLK